MHPVFLRSVRRFGFVLAAVALVTGCAGNRPMPTPPREMANVVTSADGIRIAYDAYGEEGRGTPALVFVHGWSCDRSYWEEQLQPFSRQFNGVAVDLAGHGESGLGREQWTMGAFGGDVAAVVEQLGLERIILIGPVQSYDVSPDDRRFLMLRETTPTERNEVIVTENWIEEMKARARK